MMRIHSTDGMIQSSRIISTNLIGLNNVFVVVLIENIRFQSNMNFFHFENVKKTLKYHHAPDLGLVIT